MKAKALRETCLFSLRKSSKACVSEAEQMKGGNNKRKKIMKKDIYRGAKNMT